jgi:hypothetical protein
MGRFIFLAIMLGALAACGSPADLGITGPGQQAFRPPQRPANPDSTLGDAQSDSRVPFEGANYLRDHAFGD